MTSDPEQTSSNKHPISFAAVLAEELTEIAELRDKRGYPTEEPVALIKNMAVQEEISGPSADDPLLTGGTAKKVFDEANKLNLVGLAFSGGGIRSATFNLGILQGLADHGLLSIFDYLSTVSGGGYIGSWFEAWILRAGRQEKKAEPKDAEGKPIEMECRPVRGIQAVEDELKSKRAERKATAKVEHGKVATTHTEPPEIRFLREYSNYLTPRMGLLGADTWTLIAIYLRNLLLNQMVLTLFLFSMLLLPYVAVLLTWKIQNLNCAWLGCAAPVSAFLLVLFALMLGARNVKGLLGGANEMRDENDRWFPQKDLSIVATIVAPIFLAAWILTAWLWSYTNCSTPGAGVWALGGLAILGIPCALSYRSSAERSPDKQFSWELQHPLLIWVLSAMVMGVLAGLLMFAVFHNIFEPMQSWLGSSYHELALGVPLTALVILLAATIHMGLVGRTYFDPYREWWARLAGWIFIIAIVWTAGFAFAFYAPLGVMRLGRWLKTAGLAWVASTATGVIGGKSSKTGDDSSPSWKDKALSVAPYAFIAGLVSLLSLSLELICVRVVWAFHHVSDFTYWCQFLGKNQEVAKVAKWVLNLTGTVTSPSSSLTISGTVSQGPAAASTAYIEAHWHLLDAVARSWYIALLCAVLFLLCLFVSWRVDLNEFSMNLFYRNRLVRCYLGATREKRDPNPFTGFDSGDDFLLTDLRSKECYSGPFPIFNSTLNLVSTQDLAWQERKAESFPITPFRCGYDTWLERVDLHGDFPKGQGKNDDSDMEMYAFRPVERYAYPDGGFFLGTAVSISGAALSPNMGYHSTPSLAVLMTFFNVRLGFWAGNPRDKQAWMRPGPRVGLGRLLAELFGQTDDNSKYVYLSDGGHFENLGVYELLKRRCHCIVACDAGADPDYTLEDLANAVRKCREDVGVEIELVSQMVVPPEGKDAEKKKHAYSPWHFVVGKIHYEMIDPDAKQGVFVYIKASLTGDEPADVLNYQSQHPDFPHETTADQWFTESQFESYRRLGQHIIESMFENERTAKDLKPHKDIRRENGPAHPFTALEKKWGIEAAKEAVKKAASYTEKES
jgi:hypothetical protein